MCWIFYFLSFIKKEDERLYKEYNLKGRNYSEILKYMRIHKKINNIETYNLSNSQDIIRSDNNALVHKGKCLIYTNNSCRYYVFMTLYLFYLISFLRKIIY